MSARRSGWPDALIALFALSGISLLIYPSAASWVAQSNQSNVVYDQSIANRETAVAERDEMLDNAHEYNGLLESGALLEGGRSVATGTGEVSSVHDYWDLLRPAPTGTMARVRVPAIDLDLPVYHGTAEKTLLKGVGHLQGTSLPVGGAGTRAVLTGHRGLASAEMFTRLDEVGLGDRITIDVLGEVITYSVIEIEVVAPDATEEIRPVEGEDLLTLVTCTPLGINTHRILVTAERVDPTPQSEIDAMDSRPDVPGRPWWLVVLVISMVAVGTWYWRGRKASRRNHLLRN